MAVDDDQGQAEPLSILSGWPAGGRRNGAIVEATIIDRVTEFWPPFLLDSPRRLC